MAESEDIGLTGKQYAKKLLAYGLGANAVETTIGGFKCYLQSRSVSSGGDDKMYKDNTGEPCSLVISDIHQEISCEGLVIKDGSDTLPGKGDEVDIGPSEGVDTSGVTFRVQTCSVQWQNEDVAKVSITMRGYRF